MHPLLPSPCCTHVHPHARGNRMFLHLHLHSHSHLPIPCHGPSPQRPLDLKNQTPSTSRSTWPNRPSSLPLSIQQCQPKIITAGSSIPPTTWSPESKSKSTHYRVYLGSDHVYRSSGEGWVSGEEGGEWRKRTPVPTWLSVRFCASDKNQVPWFTFFLSTVVVTKAHGHDE